MLRDQAEEALRQVYDPEIPVNIYELGLVYRILTNQDNDIKVEMTLTAPGCGASAMIFQDVEDKLKAIPGVGRVEVVLTFDPPWNREMMSEEAKLELGWL